MVWRAPAPQPRNAATAPGPAPGRRRHSWLSTSAVLPQALRPQLAEGDTGWRCGQGKSDQMAAAVNAELMVSRRGGHTMAAELVGVPLRQSAVRSPVAVAILMPPSPGPQAKTRMAGEARGIRLSSPEVARLEVRIDGRLSQQLEDIASQLGHGASKAEVVRRALALYLLAKEREASGAKLQFTGPIPGETETIINI